METRKASATRRAAPAVKSAAEAPDVSARGEGIEAAAQSGEQPASVETSPSDNVAIVGADQDTPTDAAPNNDLRVTRVGYAPIVRVDAARREIELCATSEALDSYGTVFDYAASKDAFSRWIGNVREMHERRAVGSRVMVRCDDAERKVYVRVRISRGAADTWEKVLDGTLRGASIGASDVVWERQARRVAGRERLLNVATRYDLVELSLVDNPSNPDALGIAIVRDKVPDAAVLDDLTVSGRPPGAPTPSPDASNTERETAFTATETGGTPLAAPAASAGTEWIENPVAEPAMRFPEPAPADDLGAPPEERIARQAMAHGWAAVRASAPAPSYTNEEESTDASHEHATLPTSPFRANGKESQEARSAGPFSASAEGYPDMGVPERAEERPTNALGMREDGGGNVRERFHAAARGILMGCGCPLCEGALAALGETGMTDENAQRTQAPHAGGIADAARESALARALASGLSASVARMERVDESVRGLGSILQAALNQLEGTAGALRRRVEALEGQPLPGGPAAFALDKTLALTPSGGAHSQPGAAEQRRALESLAGKLADPQAQIAVAAELIRLQRGE